MKKIIIMSLGEIIKPDFTVSINAFVEKITQKHPKLTAQSKEIRQKMSGLIFQNKQLIYQFKCGGLTEEQFIEKLLPQFNNLINAMVDPTDIGPALAFTDADFRQAWAAMQPSLATFKADLTAASSFNQSPGQQLIFMSFTNSLDIKTIKENLANEISYDEDRNGDLTTIAGMRLYLSYTLKKDKPALLAQILSDLTKNTPATPLSQPTTEAQQLIYIVGNNEINDPTLRRDYDHFAAASKEIAKQAEAYVIVRQPNQPLNELFTQPPAQLQQYKPNL